MMTWNERIDSYAKTTGYTVRLSKKWALVVAHTIINRP